MSEDSKGLIFSCIFSLVLNFIIFGILVFTLVLIEVSYDLPSYRQLSEYDPPTITRLYTGEGTVVAEYAHEKRIFVSYEEIPGFLIEAFVAAEDKNFFLHRGIDFEGIVRALIYNIVNFNSQRRVVGGSTITQQVVKHFFLNSERTMIRKIKEAILAMRITSIYSKERIMELYLNQIFLGNNSYGIVAAAQNYFNKALGEIDRSEAAMLAALPKAPTTLNPFLNYDRSIARRNWVLQRMFEEKFITQDQRDYFSNNALSLKKRSINLKVGENFYIDAVRQRLIEMYGEEAVYREGFIVNINLDENIQKIADQVFKRGILEYDRKHGWRGALARIQITNYKHYKGGLLEAFKVRDKKLFDEFQEILKHGEIKHGGNLQNSANRDYSAAIVLKLDKEKAVIGLYDASLGVIPLKNMKWARKNLPDQKLGSSISFPSDVLKVGDIILVSRGLQCNDEDASISESKLCQYSLEQLPEINGAMVVMEPMSGKVLAIVGGYDFQSSNFNRAIQALRQPGSAFKPFVYLAALENGFTKDSLADDKPISIFQGQKLKLWEPKNYNGRFEDRAVTLGEAFRRSLNIPTIRFLLATGLKPVFNLAQRLSIYKKEISGYSYAAALGAFEVTLMNLTNANNIIASGGYSTVPKLIDSIYDRRGKMIYGDESIVCKGCSDIFPFMIEELRDEDVDRGDLRSHLPTILHFKERLINEKDNQTMLELMADSVQNGTSRKARVLNRPIAGKTGTTNNNFDNWFIGFSGDLTVGIYLGFDNPKTMGANAFGSTTALPIFVDFMQKAQVGTSITELGYLAKESEVVVTNAKGEAAFVNDLDEGIIKVTDNDMQQESEIEDDKPKNRRDVLDENFHSLESNDEGDQGKYIVDALSMMMEEDDVEQERKRDSIVDDVQNVFRLLH